MINLFNGLLTKPPERKTAIWPELLRVNGQSEGYSTPRNYLGFARDGYGRNPVMYRCVRMIAEAVSSVPLGNDDPAILALLQGNGGPAETGLMEQLVSHLLLSGNAYIEALSAHEDLLELHILRPDRMQVMTNTRGHCTGWLYQAGTQRQVLPADPDTGRHAVLHVRMFHPADDHYGQGPAQAAACAVDVHNAGASWNKAMLDNAARPSGALVYHPDNQSNLSQAQFDRLKEELISQHQGAANAGRPLLLEGGLDWKPMGYSPTDMDFLQTRHAAAREIALCFGVPPMLLGIPGDATYANFREANRAFWRQSVVPLVRKISAVMGPWLSAWMGREVRLEPDLNHIPALQEDLASLWKRVGDADFLGPDEKRALLGLPERGNE